MLVFRGAFSCRSLRRRMEAVLTETQNRMTPHHALATLGKYIGIAPAVILSEASLRAESKDLARQSYAA